MHEYLNILSLGTEENLLLCVPIFPWEKFIVMGDELYVCEVKFCETIIFFTVVKISTGRILLPLG